MPSNTESDPPSFRIVALYANDSCVEIIRRFLRDRKHPKEAAAETGCGFWKMDELLTAGTYKAVAEAAKRAETVVVSTGTGQEVPTVVRYWLEASLKRRRGQPKCTLVAIVGGTRQEGGTIEDQLQMIAMGAGAEFAAYYFDPLANESLGSFSRLDERSATVTTVLSEILKHKETPHPWRVN